MNLEDKLDKHSRDFLLKNNLTYLSTLKQLEYQKEGNISLNKNKEKFSKTILMVFVLKAASLAQGIAERESL